VAPAPAEPEFGGRIGRTYHDSTPWWPAPPAGLGGPNVVMIVLDDTGFGHFGCYGSELATPHIDALAASGLRYTGFHTTALCSPSRAALLTGRNPHAIGMRGVSNWNTGYPHMRGGISPRAATVATLLRAHGYATYAAGKWHLAPMHECSAAGPHHNWPLQQGFDRFYGFLQGETDQFYPELTSDNGHTDPPGRPEDGYHLSADIVDRATGWIGDLQSIRPDRPFFLYLAFGATHAPHQSPPGYRQRWRGRFDDGYDAARQRWYQRQLELGVIPAGTTLAPPNPGVPAWADLTVNQQAFSARLQEAFAAMLEHTDAQIGRLTGFLRERGLLDNTLLLVLSDNGASREGGPYGVLDEFSFFNGRPEDIDEIAAHRLDDIGGPHSHSNYPWGWAQAGNTPLRWYKQNTYGGGVRDPLIVHWPAGIGDQGAFRRQFCHAVDITPTILQMTGAPAPGHVGGVAQLPMHGQSLAGTFADAAAPPPRPVQYFEQMGHRGLWADGWKITTYHVQGQSFDDDEWGLYHLESDFSECHDRSAEQPGKLRELIETWWAQAGQYGVLPLDDRTIELFGAVPRPGTVHGVARRGTGQRGRSEYVYYPPVTHIPADACPPLGGRSWLISAEVEVAGPAEGVLYARGGHNAGHSFFLAGGQVHFDYNALGTHYRASGPLVLSPGRHAITARLERNGPGGRLVVGSDGRDLGSADVPHLIRMPGSTGVDIGRDALSPVTGDYAAPFPFDGTIVRITFSIASRADREDVAATARTELARELSGDLAHRDRDVGVGLVRGDLAQPVHRVPDVGEPRDDRYRAQANAVGGPVVGDDAVADQGLADLPGVGVAEADMRAATACVPG
jgi:arylsulfatase A-like enzyme